MVTLTFDPKINRVLPLPEGKHVAKFGSIWPSSFRGEDFFNISQSETRIALGGHICWRNGTVFGNNSKTVNNIRNLTWVEMISTGRSNYPEILKKI
jgi:hypothetical protein